MHKIVCLGVLMGGLGIAAIGTAQYGFSFFATQQIKPYVSPRMLEKADKHEFVFARLAYPVCSTYGNYSKNWGTDFPKADRQVLIGIKRLSVIDAYDGERPVRLGQDELNRYPFIYIVEPGYMCLRPEDADEIREYLLRGGFLFLDDFWGTAELDHLEDQLDAIFPSKPIVELSVDHPVFQTVFPVEEFVQVPNVGTGMQGGPTHESDGYVPRVYGIFDEDERLIVLIFHNTDLGDAWEWAENPYFPLKYGNYAYRIIVNVAVYVMSH